MAVVPDMESFLGKNINDICKNNFHDANANHCAHFVSHAMGLGFAFNCKQFVGGNKPAANIRVHEVFANCPRVGRWANANTSMSQLIFVTRKDVVDVATKTMQNIPQKHIGIFHNDWVYHYSNTNDEVVKQTVPDFLDRFQRAYVGDQGLFFGEFPLSDLELAIDITAESVSHPFSFALRKDGSRWFAQRADVSGSPEFLVGTEVNQPAKRFHGLHFPVSAYYGPLFNPTDYVATVDHWAYLLDVTAFCESKNRFNLINTYDRAHCTFGFYQLAAHTPRDNLILFFRSALADSDFARVFPDLKLIGGKVFRVATDGTETDLEKEFFDPTSGEQQIQRFMTYLNPKRLEVDEQEVLQAARLVWLGNESATCRQIQVNIAATILQRKMSECYNEWYDLDGQRDTICAIIADIHHHGRGTKTAVREALQSRNKEAALLRIGEDRHAQRVETLKARIKKWKDAGILGQKKYQASLNEFG